MKKDAIVIGGIYVMKVSGSLTKVKVLQAYEAYNGRTHWTGRNLVTGREVSIKSAAKLRRQLCPDCGKALPCHCNVIGETNEGR